MEKINTPIWFNALGFDDGINFKPSKINDFQQFLTYLVEHPKKYFVSVRNDGSIELMSKYMSNALLTKIATVPDGGFFVKPCRYFHPEINANKKDIVINPAGDMPRIRFGEDISREQEYIKEFARQISELLHERDDIQLIFVAHHHDDLTYISKIITILPDWYRRRRISIAPFVPNYDKADYIFALYRKAHIVVGGRFHSNLCAIAQGTPTIGILSYHKHKYIYKQYDMRNRMLEVDKGEISRLKDKIIYLLNEDIWQAAKEQNIKLVEKLRFDLRKNHQKMQAWLCN